MTPNGSHGTQIAGIIGAEKDNSIGIAGANENVKIMPLIVFDEKKNYAGHEALGKAIKYAVNNGAGVINISLGSNAVSGYDTTINEAIKYAYKNNVLVVVSAGNGDTVGGIGYDLNTIPQSPTCNDNEQNMVIGVGSVDKDNFRTSWSNYGSNCVDIWAPGVLIVSTAVPAYSSLGEFYDISDGTSFSAPIVAGIVSLIKAAHSSITSQEVINLLIQNSNNGVIDAYKTLLASANYTPINSQPILSATGSPSAADNVAKGIDTTSTVVPWTNVNIRKLPSADAKIVGVAKKGLQYKTVDLTNKNWVKIEFNSNNTGWLMKKYVNISQNNQQGVSVAVSQCGEHQYKDIDSKCYCGYGYEMSPSDNACKISYYRWNETDAKNYAFISKQTKYYKKFIGKNCTEVESIEKEIYKKQQRPILTEKQKTMKEEAQKRLCL